METIKTALVGCNLSKSRFGTEMVRLGAANGLRIEHRNLDFAGDPGVDPGRVLTRLRDEGFRGSAITYPFKESAARWIGADGDDAVRTLGATNLVLFRPVLSATNTDFSGFLAAWRQRFGVTRPRRVAVAGAGGVARAIVGALQSLGAEDIAVWDREAGRATALASSFGAPVRAVAADGAAEVLAAADGFANATPVGSHHAPGTPVDPGALARLTWVFDAIYTPIETEVIAAARTGGLRVLTGFDLFRGMLLNSFCALSGLSADRVRMPEIPDGPEGGA